MSYDVDLDRPECPTCKHSVRGPTLPDPTYNLSPIFDFALTGESFPNASTSEGAVVLLGAPTDRPRGLRVLSGKTGQESLAMLQLACERLNDPKLEATFRALEPLNKWGTLEDAQEVMPKYRDAATKFPDHVWNVR
jgi:hypothetical protein